MTTQKNVVLITGANGGVGYEVARQLLSDESYHVLLGSRSASKGEAALDELKAQNLPGSVELLVLDVDSKESIVAAAKHVDISRSRLDLLVNNAGIASFAEGMPIEERLPACYKTNAIARIVDVSSGVGSVGLKLDRTNYTSKYGCPEYRASKSAMNMLMACSVIENEESGIKIFAICPGLTVSNLGPMNKEGGGAQPTGVGAKNDR